MINSRLIDIRFVEDLVLSFNGSAHLKDINSGKYVFSNETNAINVGVCKAEDIYGLTVWDLDLHMRPNWGNLAERIDKFEKQIQNNCKIILDDNQITSLPNEYIAVHNMRKYPLINQNNKVSTILTLSEHITDKIDPLQLFELYLNFYSLQGRKFAISLYLRYLGILSYFEVLPTVSELRVLLMKRKKLTTKALAQYFVVSPSTIETHLKQIRNKVNTDIHTLVENLNVV